MMLPFAAGRNLFAAASMLGLLVLGSNASRADDGIVLRVGDQKGGSQALLAAAGELKDSHFRIEWKEFPAAAPLLEALNAGVIDAGFVGDAPFTFAIAAGIPVRVIAAEQSNPESLAIVVPPQSPIHTIQDLKGRRIGTGKGSIGHYLVLSAFDHAGFDLRDANIVFLSPADANTALSGGSIDAWSTWDPYTALAEIRGERRVVDGKGIASGLAYEVASPSAIATKRAALEDYLRRDARARRWAIEHAEDYANTWASLMELPAAAAKLWIKRANIHPVPITDAVIANQQRVVDLYAKYGVIKTRFDIAVGFDRSFNSPIAPSEAARADPK